MKQTIVVKVGTSTLTQGTSHLSKPSMVEIVRQIAMLHHQGYRVLLVSSGAMAAGREKLGQTFLPASMPVKQMLSAIGQGHLMRIYSDLFSLYDVQVGQVLITGDDVMRHRGRYLNARDTLEMLLTYHVLPIINENDTVAVDEIKVGDNDNLSALIASLINADLLILLTDRDGVYNKDPQRYPDAEKLEVITAITDEVRSIGGAVSSSGLGTGGMQTKLQAAEVAGRSGIETIIANGSQQDVLLRLIAGENLGTRIQPQTPRVESRKRWLLAEPPTGTLMIDAGAIRALRMGDASLLPIGIKQVKGQFERGALVAIEDMQNSRIAHGLSNYNSQELVKICGLHSEQIEATLGYTYGEVAIHRDNLALLQPKNSEVNHS